MKNVKMSLKLFFIGYLIATIVGFISYYININLMWILIFTLMPIIFGYLFYFYFWKTKCEESETLKETNRLIVLWITVSFLLDAVVYIIIIPIVYGHKSNWTFFIEQTPWIWLNYMTIILLGHISRFIYLKKLRSINP
jgi:hypothetical protein